MKYSFLIIFICGGLNLFSQQQLELLIPVGLSGFNPSTQDQYADEFDEALLSFSSSFSTGFTARYAFSSLGKRFNLIADIGYRRLNANYTIEEEDADNPPVWLQRNREVSYTDHCIYGGLNYRFNLLQSGNQGIAIQAKTLLSIPLAGEFRTDEELRFANNQDIETDEDYKLDLIYDEDLNLVTHLNLAVGLLYTYRFSKFSLLIEANYEYKQQLNSNNASDNASAFHWQNIYLGLGAGYLLSSGNKIEGDQDAFFK
jgi:hypothetical protein